MMRTGGAARLRPEGKSSFAWKISSELARAAVNRTDSPGAMGRCPSRISNCTMIKTIGIIITASGRNECLM